MQAFVFFSTCLHFTNQSQNIGMAWLTIQKVYKNHKYTKLYRLLKISGNSKKFGRLHSLSQTFIQKIT